MTLNERRGGASALILTLAAAAAAAQASPPASGQLSDIVVKAQQSDQPSEGKPAFDVPYDPYETLRATLKPDETLLLAQSPSLTRWVGGEPRLLKDERLIQPWNDALTTLSTLRLPVPSDLAAGVSAPEKDLRWSLSLVDEDGKAVRSFDGKGAPPEAVEWDGKTQDGGRLRAGHAYSAVYRCWDGRSDGAAARTIFGRPLRFAGLVVESPDGRVIGLDSSVLFGADRRAAAVAPEGRVLLRAAADYVRRRAFGAPLSLRLFGPDGLTAEAQASAARAALAQELGLPADRIAVESEVAGASEQRLELAVSGR